jgi:hypothetical protein
MHIAFVRPNLLLRRALMCAILLVVAPVGSVASARNVSVSIPSTVLSANASSARLTIKNGFFGRATVVVAKGGTLTLANADNVAYRVKVGATLVVVRAKGSKTIPLPQRGTFSITCTKAPNLRATLIVE